MAENKKQFARVQRSTRGFAAKLEKTVEGHLCYIQTKEERGYDAFYFVILFPEKAEEFDIVARRPGVFDIREFGTIVVSGFGRTPHQAARDKIKELFDLDADILIEEAKQKRKKGEA